MERPPTPEEPSAQLAGKPPAIRRRWWRYPLYGLAALGVLGAGALAAFYTIDGQPLPEARTHLLGEGFCSSEAEDGSFVFTPSVPNGQGILLMHGALIRPVAYARTAAFFAQKGYTVFLPSGSGRLSIRAVEGAAQRMDGFGLRGWYLIGHSMGGLASLRLFERRPAGIRAIALWAAAVPEDHRAVSVPVLFLHGDRDGLVPPESLSEVRAHLPSATTFVPVEGGNHRGFALYTHQFFDGEATLSQDSQIDLANERTAAFFAGVP